MPIAMDRADPLTPPAPIAPARLPDWLRGASRETVDEAAFSAGAALALLDQAQRNPGLPQALWRDRLALAAAAQSARIAGRPEGEAAIRDVLCLLRPGEAPGPAGEIALTWQRATERPLSEAALTRALRLEPRPDSWQAARSGDPVTQAATVIEAVLAEQPRGYLTAAILGDSALARALNWDHPIPLLGSGLSRRDLAEQGEALRLACHRAVVKAAGPALQLASDLTRRAAGLRTVAPNLRAKLSDRVVDLFLTRDAVSPAMLTGFMSDRAARRICDRLVDLGVARELTGRDAFRLYGL